MKKLTKHIAATVASVTITGAAVLGAGGTASAATPATAHVQRPSGSVKAADCRWDHGVGYLLEQGYSWDEIRGWHHDGRVTDSAGHDRDGHFYRWDDNGTAGGPTARIGTTGTAPSATARTGTTTTCPTATGETGTA